jgi:hypothetical protein
MDSASQPGHGRLLYDFARCSERNLLREGSRIVSGLVPCDQDAMLSRAHCQFLEDLHGFIKALIKGAPVRDLDVDRVQEGGHGLSFLLVDCSGYFDSRSLLGIPETPR